MRRSSYGGLREVVGRQLDWCASLSGPISCSGILVARGAGIAGPVMISLAAPQRGGYCRAAMESWTLSR